MTRRQLTKTEAISAVYGGCILGGGGGGWIYDGLEKADAVFEKGAPILATIDEFSKEDYAACVALVGAPSAKNLYVDAPQLVKTIEMMQSLYEHPISAIMTNENGASTTINGWLQAVETGLPFIDAPCNGRAHPIGSMGSLNLSEKTDYTSVQTFAGGKGDYQVAGSVSASLSLASDTVRAVSIQAGGMVGVCRNPVTIDYVEKNAAVGGITQAIQLGEVFLAIPEGYERIEKVVEYLEGEIVLSGNVDQYELRESGGLDIGLIQIGQTEITIWNEYMTLETKGKRVGTFPDLIMTFDTATGRPLVSAEIKAGMDITVINVPKEKLLLSTTMSNQKLLKAVEDVINKKMIEIE
ncbi:DUF917 family protein [Alkalihalobacillus trypoxylicola]|uniref:OsrF n=1 Tax=Alkalihalobacillus trypoxylicola TaxID=519424 RepID=A0A162EUA6_9BACI|nr:DUF917 family protein [Alkalihalobacillus trypoxylicola]KYG33742.1 hypothetical protein AZF04_16100 [Alkalihalobacillus trypoxylicola]